MQKTELYHIHTQNDKDQIWKPNKTIVVTKKFDSVMNQRHQNFSQMMYFSDGENPSLTNYSYYVADYFNRIKDAKIVKREELDELKRLLEIGYQMSYNADFFKREAALESCRVDNYSSLPSRLHSIYLCDKDGLEYWEDTISKNHKEKVEIFEVEVNGNVFKTNEQLLPREVGTYEEAYEDSHSYWHPRFIDTPNFTNEYLAQGEIKVLNKVK